MSGRSLGCLAAMAILAAPRCSPSPVGPVDAPADEPRTVQPAVHVDCDAAEDIRARIDALEDDGTLNHGEATALRAKLDQAGRWENEGRPDRAAETYARLIGQVEGWLADGTLSEEEVQDLLACAEDVHDGSDGPPFVAISAGVIHTCGVTALGVGYCWGRNSGGLLGDGNAGTDSHFPVAVAGGLRFESISAGITHTCGVTVGGAGYCWGLNELGQLGDGTLSDSDVPAPVAGLLNFESISAGYFHTCGVVTGGDAYCWGRNTEGALGDGTLSDSNIPVLVAGELTFESITVGRLHTCAVTTSGDAYCWGFNSDGQIGDDRAASSFNPAPIAVVGGHVFTLLDAGAEHNCGVTSTGDGYCWGRNDAGQLGAGNHGSDTDSDIPVGIVGELAFESISSGQSYSCGITTLGDSYCWGANNEGQLGDGNAPGFTTTPVAVADAHGSFESLSAGVQHACGVTIHDDAYCWGRNEWGQLGNGIAGTDSDIPIPVASP